MKSASLTPNPAFLISILLLLCSCGLEDVLYLDYVKETDIVRTVNYHVDIKNLPAGPGHPSVNKIEIDFTTSQIPSIRSPNTSGVHDPAALGVFFGNFQIYYRIYMSGILLNSTINESDMTMINPTLASDYNSLKPYTVTTNNYAASVGSAFSGRNYWIVDELSTNYILRSSQLITPYPEDRYFFNDDDLKAPVYLNPNNNADVVTNPSGTAYTYVSMYVVHKAFNDITLTPYYSVPAFLGVFLLPNTP